MTVFLANLDPLLVAVAIVLGIYLAGLLWLCCVMGAISDREGEE